MNGFGCNFDIFHRKPDFLVKTSIGWGWYYWVSFCPVFEWDLNTCTLHNQPTFDQLKTGMWIPILVLHRGSEDHSFVFKWSQRGRPPSGPVFKSHLKTVQPDHLKADKLFFYILVRYLNGQHRTKHIDRPLEYQTICNPNFTFCIQMFQVFKWWVFRFPVYMFRS